MKAFSVRMREHSPCEVCIYYGESAGKVRAQALKDASECYRGITFADFVVRRAPEKDVGDVV